VAKKIDRLFEFGAKKDYDYDQVLNRKSRKKIVIEIITLYRVEMRSAIFAKQLKNNLDKTLVKNISSNENGQELKIPLT
jgi:hypothetical protein